MQKLGIFAHTDYYLGTSMPFVGLLACTHIIRYQNLFLLHGMSGEGASFGSLVMLDKFQTYSGCYYTDEHNCSIGA